ncbi:hypothetical protein [Thermofilum pendens]|uniref:Uncharacterized protein n=1 Tax=Thermofilum pendens (strain DSM 2475 / Hrk 5) TaxID=368408 RepID=A1RXZ4_THEPD|nr:hypothetical protein [Thermofilum pendens]ABL78074.1 hypothetical protein Tpen_0672 [Thermofilum pendens Hrk 5]
MKSRVGAFLLVLAVTAQSVTVAAPGPAAIQLAIGFVRAPSDSWPLWSRTIFTPYLLFVPSSAYVDNVVVGMGSNYDYFLAGNDSVSFNVQYDGAVKLRGSLSFVANITVSYGGRNVTVTLPSSGSAKLNLPPGELVTILAPSVVNARYSFQYTDVGISVKISGARKVFVTTLRPFIGVYNFSMRYVAGVYCSSYPVEILACRTTDYASCKALYRGEIKPQGWWYGYILQPVQLLNFSLNNEYLGLSITFCSPEKNYVPIPAWISSYVNLPLFFSHWLLPNGTRVYSTRLVLRANGAVSLRAVYRPLPAILAVKADRDVAPALKGSLSLQLPGATAAPAEALLGSALITDPRLEGWGVEWGYPDAYPRQPPWHYADEYTAVRRGVVYAFSTISYRLYAEESLRRYYRWSALDYRFSIDPNYYRGGVLYDSRYPFVLLGEAIGSPPASNGKINVSVTGIRVDAGFLGYFVSGTLEVYRVPLKESLRSLGVPLFNGSLSAALGTLNALLRNGTLGEEDLVAVYRADRADTPIVVANARLAAEKLVELTSVYEIWPGTRVSVYRVNLSRAELVYKESLRNLGIHRDGDVGRPAVISNVGEGRLWVILRVRLYGYPEMAFFSASFSVSVSNFTDYKFRGWKVYRATFEPRPDWIDSWGFRPTTLLFETANPLEGLVSPGEVVLAVAEYGALTRATSNILKVPVGVDLAPFDSAGFTGLAKGLYSFYTNATVYGLSSEGVLVKLEDARGTLRVNEDYAKARKVKPRDTESVSRLPLLVLPNGTAVRVFSIEASRKPSINVLELNSTVYLFEVVEPSLSISRIEYNETHVKIAFQVEPPWSGMRVSAFLGGRLVAEVPASLGSISLPYEAFQEELSAENLTLLLTWGGSLSAGHKAVSLAVLRAIPHVRFTVINGSWKAFWVSTYTVDKGGVVKKLEEALLERGLRPVGGRLYLEVAGCGSKFPALWRAFLEPGHSVAVPAYDTTRYCLYVYFIPEGNTGVVVAPWEERL